MLEVLECDLSNSVSLPLFASKVAAGFPSPAEDFIEGSLDINKLLVRQPTSTFYVRVFGDSMENIGIFTGDILVVDRSLNACSNSIVIAIVGDELVVKRLKIFDDKIELHSENDTYDPLVIKEPDLVKIWGVVCGLVRQF